MLENLLPWFSRVPWTSQKVCDEMNFEMTEYLQDTRNIFTYVLSYLISILLCVSVCVLPALYAVKVRAEAMQAASEQTPSGMLSVIGKPQAKYNYACLLAREHCMSLGIHNPVCMVANYLFPDGRVIAGHQEVGYKHCSHISVAWWTRLFDITSLCVKTLDTS